MYILGESYFIKSVCNHTLKNWAVSGYTFIKYTLLSLESFPWPSLIQAKIETFQLLTELEKLEIAA